MRSHPMIPCGSTMKLVQLVHCTGEEEEEEVEEEEEEEIRRQYK